MNYYKDKETGEVFAYDDEQVEQGVVKEGLVKMTASQVKGFLNPTETEAQAKERVRAERDQKFSEIEWRITRYQTQKALGVDTVDTEEWYMSALQYMQDLRDIPEQDGFPKKVQWPVSP